MTIEEMKRIKQEKGYSVADISDLTGLPIGTITKIFSGQTVNPRRATVEALEKLFLEENHGGRMNRNIMYDFGRSLPEANMVCEAAISYGAPIRKQGEYTVVDLEKMEDHLRVELIDGVLYDMAPPTVTHSRISLYLYRTAAEYIDRKGGNCEAFPDGVGVFLDDSDTNCLIPDFSIVCDGSIIQEKGICGAPDFVLEILSPSSEIRDTVIKKKKYMESGVREYWIIDRKRRSVYIHLKDDPYGRIHPLSGKLGTAIYNGELEIDLDRIAAIMDKLPEKN